MSFSICLFEDQAYQQFFPITHLRPVYAMRPGIVPLLARSSRVFGQADLSLACREQVAPLLAAEFPDYPVNIIKRGEAGILFLNGRIRDCGDLPDLVRSCRISTVFERDNETIAILLQSDNLSDIPDVATPGQFQAHFDKISDSIGRARCSATLYNYSWEIMADIGGAVSSDFEEMESSLPDPRNVVVHDGAHFVNEGQVYLGSDVVVYPGAVLDASAGPVFVGDNSKIESQATIYGPCYIGPNSIIYAGKITACSIGHTCRVGGEVEESIFQSYVNKHHAGFIGHSYVGSWVNFGAITTNSDLKNNYANVKVTIGGRTVDTGTTKVGSFIGDHTRFGIGMLLNTGVNIGVCCNLFGGGLIADREVPSFSWGNSDGYQLYRFAKAIETIRIVTQRRGYNLGEREEALLQSIAEGTLTDQGVLTW